MPVQVVGNSPSALPFRAVARPAPEARAEPTQAAMAQPAQLEAAVQSANRFFQQIAPALEFSVDQASGRAVTRLVDKVTNMVIRQIPSEEMLSIARTLDHFQGLLLKLKA